MSLTDEPAGGLTDRPAPETPVDKHEEPVPSKSALWWPVVQALRELGRPATDAEVADHVADSLNLTHRQRTQTIPSGQETRLKNRAGWAAHELKEIGAVHYPKPGYRALTDLGLSIDEEQITALRAKFISSKSPSEAKQRGGHEQARTPAAWLIRAGRQGERYDYNIEHGLACLGWDDQPDLRGFSNQQELWDDLRLNMPDDTDRAISSYAGQLWRMRTDVRLGDVVVMPRKGAPQIALGTVTRRYWFDDISNVDWGRHVVAVDWKRTDVPVAAIKQDLQRSLRGLQTIYALNGRDVVWRLQQLMETGQDPGQRADEDDGPQDLSMLVEQFRAETDYPTEAHEEQERLRAEWAEKLAPENVGDLSRRDLLAYTSNAVHYGQYVTLKEGLQQQWIDDLDPAGYNRLLDSIRDLCWGEDELSTRIDRLTDQVGGFNKDTGTKGFTGLQVSRTLAICHPEQVLPLPSQIGKWGREVVLRALGLPAVHGSYGQRVVDANNRLREHLVSYFKKDTAGMVAFINWFKAMGLTKLAGELLVDVDFLKDIVSLLEDKGQVILYGPPGTGKTYLARALAKVLAPDEACRALVQFHPSTSYEDFFEGYRPAGTDGGAIQYKLTHGPLALMADQAEDAPDKRHVMIIDEINRGNLPRVLGELLFLLEYRDESVFPLYRPDEPFSLPENLWFIGTMNTADRSIALVDAALRRRFHFLPFFPDKWPMAGLLARWLERQGEPGWVGDLVDEVNDELKKALEGSHLLLGPSHFMKKYGSSPNEQREQLRRIWEYNIEPFIEDQFFGDPDRIAHFRFDAVMRRNGPAAESDVDASDDGDDLESTDESEDS